VMVLARENVWRAIAALVIILSSPARAQQPDAIGSADDAARVLARLDRGQQVRIRAKGDGRLEGRVLSNSERFITIGTAGAVTELPAEQVDSLWVRTARTGRGALIGGAALGLGFGALGASVCPGECNVSSGTAFVRGGLLGVLFGGAIGALVGSAVHHWQLRLL
jgi:hypothetical protein